MRQVATTDGRVLAIVALGLALAACACVARPDGVQLGPELAGPVVAEWHPDPDPVVDGRLAPTMARLCLWPDGQIANAAGAGFVDVRGGGHMAVGHAAADRYRICEISVTADGLAYVDGGSTGDLAPVAPAPGGVEVMAYGSMGSDDVVISSIQGRVGAGAAGVRVELEDGSSLDASSGGGLFFAWWPGQLEPRRVTSLGPGDIELDSVVP